MTCATNRASVLLPARFWPCLTRSHRTGTAARHPLPLARGRHPWGLTGQRPVALQAPSPTWLPATPLLTGVLSTMNTVRCWSCPGSFMTDLTKLIVTGSSSWTWSTRRPGPRAQTSFGPFRWLPSAGPAALAASSGAALAASSGGVRAEPSSGPRRLPTLGLLLVCTTSSSGTPPSPAASSANVHMAFLASWHRLLFQLGGRHSLLVQTGFPSELPATRGQPVTRRCVGWPPRGAHDRSGLRRATVIL